MTISKEVVSYGFVLLGSAISQLLSIPWIHGPFSLYVQYAAFSLIIIGIVLIFLGIFWRWGPWKRPLGISLLAVGYFFVGLLAMIMGGWIFTPLFALSLVFFIVVWGIFTAKKLAKLAVEILSVIGLPLSLLGIGNDSVVNVPGILGAMYILWYVNRPHVTAYFGTQARRIIPNEKYILWISFFALLLLIPMAFFYVVPPTRKIVDWTAGRGSPASGGSSGPEYVFGVGDILEYNFHVDENSSSIIFSIKHGEMKIAETQGRNGSGEAYVPVTGQYWVNVVSVETYFKVHYEIVVQMFSLQRHILQWAFLDLFLVFTLFSFKSRSAQLS